jgi:hypothetical protein
MKAMTPAATVVVSANVFTRRIGSSLQFDQCSVMNRATDQRTLSPGSWHEKVFQPRRAAKAYQATRREIVD